MKIRLLAFILLGAATAGAQNTPPATAPTTRGGRGQANLPPAAPMPTDAVAGGMEARRVYPTNMATIETPRAGILGLRAIEIPRYTQTGPFPDPFPTRPTVNSPSPHDPKLPTIWTIGDSTVRTGYNGTGDDRPGQWGWGCPFVGYFDAKKVNVVNRAVGGTTSGSFYLAQWKAMVDLVKKGDVVILQFGTNSGGVESPGIDDDVKKSVGRNGQEITQHSFGWYLRQFIAETRARGGTPVICSLIPRNARVEDGKIRRSATSQAGWAKQVAAAEKADFIDLNELIARKYDAMERPAVNAMFSDGTHTTWDGAVLNAETVISGLKALKNDPAAAYYVEKVKEIPAVPQL